MSVETHRVLIGACGWKHQAWLDDFYDDDLPEDWQLGFYSNEFSVVYVPASDWIDEPGLDEWKDEVAETFRFILEIPADVIQDPQRFSEILTKVKNWEIYVLGWYFMSTKLLWKTLRYLKSICIWLLLTCLFVLINRMSHLLINLMKYY